MGKLGKITRRSFLGVGIVAAGGLAVGYYYYRKPYANPLEAALAEGEATFNPYVKIAGDNTITLYTPRAEMGQGIHTTLAALIAEELDVELDQVRTEHGHPSPAYFNKAMLVEGGPFPFFDESFGAEMSRTAMGVVAKFLAMQITGGSSATVDGFEKMRAAGCAARLVLVQAAANRWEVDTAGLKTENGRIINPATNESLAYGAIAAAAARLDPPSDMALRPSSKWRLLGKPQSRVEIRDKVTGGRIFGIDVQLPDMLHGTVKMSPRFGAKAKSVDKTNALKTAGVIDVVPIRTSTGTGFGIIAENTWAAFQGAEALDVEWDTASYPADMDGIGALYDEALNADATFTFGGSGDVEAAFDDAPAAEVLEAGYSVQFLSHATMEPMNATAHFKDGALEIWTGTQAPGIVQTKAAELLGIDSQAVTVNTTRLGGGFGRRSEIDYPLYAVVLAAETGGRPIKVTWSREEDMRHGAYRPMAKSRMRARVAPGKTPTALDVKVAAQSVVASYLKRTFPDMSPMGPDKSLLDGAFNQPLTIENRRYEGVVVDLPIPVGFWRSVGNSVNGFFHECFVDEMAEKSGQDPLQFRLAMMNDDEHRPAREVLKKAAEMSGWSTPLPAGKGRGIAHTISFGTWVAQVVQVAMTDDGIRIEKVWAAADPGMVLDPEIFRDQIMSGIVFGLSQAVGQEITFAGGAAEQGNFTDFDALRMSQCPGIDIALLENSPKMGGAGEPGTPPAAAALANAVFAATGKRIRDLPLTREIDFVS